MKAAIVVVALGIGVLSAASQQAGPNAVRAEDEAAHIAASDAVARPGLPAIGKWMIASDGSIAHWLGEVLDGKRLREPINIILVDSAAGDADDARKRLLVALAAAGYPVRFGHSAGYRALIGGRLYPQLPAGRDDAFSNRIFELSNNHGRLFGPYPADGGFVAIGAFSREEIRPFRIPEHGYASFNRARDDLAVNLDRATPFKLSGFIDLANAIVGDPEVTTGDHDGFAILLRAD